MQGNSGKTLAVSVVFALSAGFGINGLAGDDVDAKVKSLVNDVCAGCHGVDGNSVVPNFPKIAGQHKKYLLSEMLDYQDSKRHSELMGPVMSSLSHEEMEGLAAYYSQQTPTPGEVTRPELLPLGKRVYLEGNTETGVPSCDGCHEEDGAGSAKFPRIAGQHQTYLLEEIARYESGERSNGKKVMKTVAHRLTKEEAEAVAEYIASLK